MGEMMTFGGSVDYEDFYMRQGALMLVAFAEWLHTLPDGESLVADLSLVNDALEDDYQGSMQMAIEAVQRLTEVAECWRGGDEMARLFTTVRDLWSEMEGVNDQTSDVRAYGC